MTKLVELALLAAVLTLLAAPTFSVRRFIAPPPPVDAEDTARNNGEEGPTENGPDAETSPLEILALRPELPKTLLRFVRVLELAKPLARPAQQRRCLPGPGESAALRVEERVIRARCAATRLDVLAPPHRPHAPPPARPIA